MTQRPVLAPGPRSTPGAWRCSMAGRIGNGPVVALGAIIAATMVTAAQDAQRRAWNRPQKPFKVFGNTYWVGTYALGSVLVTSDAGHVLIDGALPESVPQIREH